MIFLWPHPGHPFLNAKEKLGFGTPWTQERRTRPKHLGVVSIQVVSQMRHGQKVGLNQYHVKMGLEWDNYNRCRTYPRCIM